MVGHQCLDGKRLYLVWLTHGVQRDFVCNLLENEKLGIQKVEEALLLALIGKLKKTLSI